MDISILLATTRPNLANGVIDSINRVSNPNNYSYEILVVGPHEVNGHHVRWVKEDVPLGPIQAFNYGYTQSVGDFIIIMSDGILAPHNMFDIVEEIKNHPNPTLNICALGEGGGYGCKTCAKQPIGYIMRWPCISRQTIDKYLQGYIYAPGYYYHVADNWLGEWCALMGEEVHECENVKITEQQSHPHNPTHTNNDIGIMHLMIDNFTNDKKYVQDKFKNI